MEFISGVLFAASFFGVGYGAYKLGQRNNKPVPVPVDEEGQRRAERVKKGFEDMMTYDVSTALGRKK